MKWYYYILLIVIVVVLVRYFKKKKGNNSATSSETSVFPLTVGSTGVAVTNVQKALNKAIDNYNALYNDMWMMQKVDQISVDGVYGNQTKIAVKLFLGTDSVSETQYKNLIK